MITRLLILSITLFLNTFLYSQTFDFRQVNWGMTFDEVVKSELPLKHIVSDKDMTNKSISSFSDIITYPDIQVNNLPCSLSYIFINKKLAKAQFEFLNNEHDSLNLYAKTLRLLPLYHFLTMKHEMETLYCWTYDNASSKKINENVECKFLDMESSVSLESQAKNYEFVEKAIYSLQNKRTIATFELDVKKNNPEIIGWIIFQPSSLVNKQLFNNL